ncbi:hypothetical protein LCGC14_2259890, partial [marine sediment metagenome]
MHPRISGSEIRSGRVNKMCRESGSGSCPEPTRTETLIVSLSMSLSHQTINAFLPNRAIFQIGTFYVTASTLADGRLRRLKLPPKLDGCGSIPSMIHRALRRFPALLTSFIPCALTLALGLFN